jgi:hypothetical protein
MAVAAALLVSTPVFAQATANASLNVTAQVAAKAKLTLGVGSITFPDADPDVTPIWSSSAVTVDVKARTSAAGSVTLTVLASGDLSNGTQTIAITNLTWAGTGTGFTVSGINNKTTAQSVGSWTGSGNQSGSQTFSLPNSWSYATGNYTSTLNYTLTAP